MLEKSLLVQESDDFLVEDNDSTAILLHRGEPVTYSEKIPVPTIPDDWEAPPVLEEKGKPGFDDVDNPGRWCQFTSRPEFGEKDGDYKHHSLPTGATPVPGETVIEDDGEEYFCVSVRVGGSHTGDGTTHGLKWKSLLLRRLVCLGMTITCSIGLGLRQITCSLRNGRDHWMRVC